MHEHHAKERHVSFSSNCRAFASIRSDLPNAENISNDIQNIQLFLGNPTKPHNFILWKLQTEGDREREREEKGGRGANQDKKEKEKESEKEREKERDVLVAMMEHCATCLEEKQYVLPDEKHCHYRVIIHCLFLIDAPEEDGLNVFKYKKVKLERYMKLFRLMPVVPLYGDMHIAIEYVLARCKHWVPELMAGLWTNNNEVKLQREFQTWCLVSSSLYSL